MLGRERDRERETDRQRQRHRETESETGGGGEKIRSYSNKTDCSQITVLELANGPARSVLETSSPSEARDTHCGQSEGRNHVQFV